MAALDVSARLAGPAALADYTAEGNSPVKAGVEVVVVCGFRRNSSLSGFLVTGVSLPGFLSRRVDPDRMRYRLTGASGPGVGAQWDRKDDDHEIARRVLNLLADRRMLWKDFSLEIEEHCVTSANRVRDKIGDHLDNPEISPELVRQLRLLQGLFREFVDEVGHTGDGRGRSPYGTDPLSMALGRLRALVGIQVGE